MGVEHVLDLARVHVLAAGHDHVLQAVAHEEVALLGAVAEIARVHPSAAQGLIGRVGVVPVTDHQRRTAGHDLADDARWALVVVAGRPPWSRTRWRRSRPRPTGRVDRPDRGRWTRRSEQPDVSVMPKNCRKPQPNTSMARRSTSGAMADAP